MRSLRSQVQEENSRPCWLGSESAEKTHTSDTSALQKVDHDINMSEKLKDCKKGKTNVNFYCKTVLNFCCLCSPRNFASSLVFTHC